MDDHQALRFSSINWIICVCVGISILALSVSMVNSYSLDNKIIVQNTKYRDYWDGK